MIPPPPGVWPQPDGAPVSRRAKLHMLSENHVELTETLQNAFEDAVLMGVDEQAMRRNSRGPGLAPARRPMRLLRVTLLALAAPVMALAQSSGAIVATPLPPPTVLVPGQDQTPQGAPPVSQAMPAQPATPEATTAAPGSSSPQPIQLTWVPQGIAQVQVLDKVNAQSTVLTVKVGQQGAYGSLTIQVQACDTHPRDQPQDSAAYLTITDAHADAPGFKGWMLANEPSISMLQNPVYDVRVVGCQA